MKGEKSNYNVSVESIFEPFAINISANEREVLMYLINEKNSALTGEEFFRAYRFFNKKRD